MDYYLIFVVVLFALAIMDLVVGVSNDAVNFLNSAIGSNVATLRTIMIIAAAGIFFGATFSSGMMEVARKGIFNPEHFFFAELMAVFLAVMITDIILLDLFNTFGLPTSTTVSIVFELLGASVAISLVKMTAADEGLAHLGTYINVDKAVMIIAGIFLSIAVAFAVGAFVQYLSRLLFSFNYKKRIKYLIGVWGGISMAAMSYFLLVKGAKGASFMTAETKAWVSEYSLHILIGSFIVWAILLQVLNALKVNTLKFMVLFGTFALAMAFAGNDLVNFIGVPLAGMDSYVQWGTTEVPPELYSMEGLAGKVPANTWYLLIAGSVMVLTLWFSKKARTVVETSVDLSRQDEGSERFKANGLARSIVRGARFIGKGINFMLSPRTVAKMDKNFEPVEEKETDEKKPAFDLVRASVTLTVASMLISLGTSLGLPLSTTYVTFMVAMGTSLADRAWGRDSAVFRVSGVLNVIAGWFGTAIIAFTVAAVFCLIIFSLKLYGVIGLILLAATMILRGMIVHRKREKAKSKKRNLKRMGARELSDTTRKEAAQNIALIRQAYYGSIKGLIKEDRNMLRDLKKQTTDLKVSNRQFKESIVRQIKGVSEEAAEGSRVYLMAYDLEQDLVQSLDYISESCFQHVENVHSPLRTDQGEWLETLSLEVSQYLDDVTSALDLGDFGRMESILDEKNAILVKIESALAFQVRGIKKDEFNSRNSQLFFGILMESRDLVAVAARFVKLYGRVEKVELQLV